MRQQLGVAPSRTVDGVTKTYIDSAITAALATTVKTSNNLSDLASAANARTNLGLGTAALMAAPQSALVGVSDTQNLTNKTIDGITSTLNNVPAPNLSGTAPVGAVPGLPTSKITSGTFLSSIFPMFGLSHQAGTNLVLDPGFENVAAWPSAPGAQSSTQAHGGTHSWKLTGNGSGVSLYLTNTDAASAVQISTRASEIFQMGIWVYPVTANTGGGTLQLAIQLYDSTGHNSTTTVDTAWTPSALTAGSWNYLTTTLTVPTGYDLATPLFFLNNATTGDIYYVDDALVREETLAQSIISSLFGGNTVGSQLQLGAVPGLPASRITSGILLSSLIPDITLTMSSDLTSMARALFGTSAIGNQLVNTIIPDITKAMSSDLQSLISTIFGTSSIGTTVAQSAVPTGIPATKLSSLFGGSTLAVDLQNLATLLGLGSSFTSTAKIGNSSIANIFGGSSLGQDLTNLANALYGGTTVQSTIATSAVPTGIPATKVANVLGGTSLSQDMSNLSSWLYNTTTPTSATQLQSTVVPGVQGITSIATTVQNMWDNFAHAIATALGLTGVPSSGNSLSSLTSAMSAHAQATNTALNQSTSNTNAFASLTGNAPAYMSLAPASYSSAPIPTVTARGNVNLTANYATPIGFVRMPQATTLGAVSFLAVCQSSGGVSAFYINFYKLNQSTGGLTWLFSSSNISSSIPYSGPTGSPQWITYTFPGPNNIVCSPGDVIAVEFQAVGTSSSVAIFMAGCAATLVPARSTTVLQNITASRSPTQAGTSPPTGNISPSGFTWGVSGNPMYFALEVTNTPANYEPPVTNFYNTSQTVAVPSWVNYVDVIPVGAGGGGGNGFANAGNAGSSTTVTCGSNTVTAAGGAGGSSGTSGANSYAVGVGPGTESYNGTNYSGGTNVSYTSVGSSPGGGGGGGVNYGAATYGQGASPGAFNPATWTGCAGQNITITIGTGGTTSGGFNAGNGANGGVWLVFRQS